MAESVPVRCPACRREHCFSPLTFPCPCGAPVTVPLDRGGVPEAVRYRTWQDSWVAVRCSSCAHETQWPAPEFDCPCGALLRLPVVRRSESRPSPPVPGATTTGTGGSGDGALLPVRAHAPLPAAVRPAFRPVTIRTSLDVVTAAAQYLKWLGFQDVVLAEDRVTAGADLPGTGIVAQADPTTRPTTLRKVECLWLEGLASSAMGVFFSLAGYTRDARNRADRLHVPLFVMDLTGTPQPVNDAADELIRTGI
jgi:hypothetical protein